MLRSYLTQQLQNYFDSEDSRVRRGQSTLDVQLLTAFAGPLEEHVLRVARELNGRFLSRCPMNIDNSGVYYRLQIPLDFPLSNDANGTLLAPATVVGVRDGQSISLHAYDDLLPVPSSAEIDTDLETVPLQTALLGQVTSVQTTLLSPGVLPIPNTVAFWLAGRQESMGLITVLIEGEPYPRNLWPGSDRTRSENLNVTGEGLFRSKTVWYSISAIHVYGLPDGATLDVYALEMNLPFVADPTRPHQTPDDRDTLYSRFWTAQPDALLEVYYDNPEVGFPQSPSDDLPPLVSTRALDQPLSDLTLEPNTFGLLAVGEGSGTPQLYYLDRREPMPDRLDQSALTAEPCYGLQVTRDGGAVTLEPEEYAKAGTVLGYRFVIELPDEGLYIYHLDPVNGWQLEPYVPSFWAPGAPPRSVSFPLGETGTYVFRLETKDSSNVITYDAVPFAHLGFLPEATLPLTHIAHARGIAYDYRQRLWIWDGLFLHPYRLRYDAFVFDGASQSLYLTESYDEVHIV